VNLSLNRSAFADARSSGTLTRTVLSTLGYLLLVAGAIVMLLPIFWMLSTSVKPLNQIFSLPIQWWPAEPQWSNYSNAWGRFPFGRYFVNSVIVSLGVTILNVTLSGFAGFALAKYRFFGKQVVFIAILATLMLPIEVLMVPTFLIVKELNWLNSYQGLIIPAAADAFGIFLMRQTMLHIPDALIEAARIDGASEPRIFVQIILPLLWPAVLTLALFVWRETWDAFVWPLLITSQDALRTVPIGLQRFQEENLTNYNEAMAMSFISMLPLAVMFFIFQRAFIQGIAGTGIKE
jgi:ABC-type glycerol-3-phosphate transport system permease component